MFQLSDGADPPDLSCHEAARRVLPLSGCLSVAGRCPTGTLWHGSKEQCPEGSLPRVARPSHRRVRGDRSIAINRCVLTTTNIMVIIVGCIGRSDGPLKTADGIGVIESDVISVLAR